MKLSSAGTRFNCQLLAVLTALVLTGCSKKEQPSAATSASPSPQAATAAPTDQAPVANVQTIADVNAAMAAAEAATKARQYEEAAKTLLLLRERQLSAEQAQAVQQQMRDFQRNLAGAVASGNAQAKAAADMLRGSAAHR